MTVNRVAILTLALLAASCTTVNTSNPPRTATEEMLISTAADRAAAQLAIPVETGKKVFIDASNFEGTDSKYAISAIRENVLRRGAVLIDDKKTADAVIEIRSGALSTDHKQFLIGIPSFNFPVPFASGPLTFPTIALYEDDDQKGVAKFAMFGYDAKTGAPLGLRQDPRYGFSDNVQKTVMIFFSWTENDAVPENEKNPKPDEQPAKPSQVQPPG